MSFFQVLVLALAQGLTEFLPISSSAHLIIIPYFLGWSPAPVSFDVALHLGTLLALVLYFLPDLKKIIKGLANSLSRRKTIPSEENRFYSRLFWFLVLGTIPAVVLVLLFKKSIESSFTSALVSATLLLVNGVYLALADVFATPNKPLRELKGLGAFIVGVAQATALLPGISRSGVTISTGILFGLKREEAARFSFLLSIPIVLGATVLEIATLSWKEMSVLFFLAGVFISFIVGLLCVHFFLRFLRHSRLIWFAFYSWALGFFVLYKIFLA